ncbi:family 10 glycosylhydrolase [Rhizobium sp. 0TCS1.26]|uniref:family 10 glycosylhydrolase n=1 Tax=Rhizobium sp. 0TCS1.26 TaxID=3142623 RepID=UPI003D28BE75
MLHRPDAIANSSARSNEWYKSATRWTQLTFAEDDPEKYDPEFWIDVFRRTKSNAVCLSAGGYIAYYPSEIPLHYVSKFIGGTDPFGTIVEGARKLGMHVMARVDPHAIHADAAEAHPEWVAINRDGSPREHWAFPGIYVTDALGSYNRDFTTDVIREVITKYDVDAVFANRWQGHGVSYSEDNQRRFKNETGFDLPAKADASDPAWQAWAAWRRRILTELVVYWDETVKAVRPHASFIPNMSGSSLMEFDLSLIQKHCPILFVDHQARQGVEVGWSAGRNGKRIRGTFRDRPVGLITSIGPEEEYRWKDSVQSGEEIKLWIHDGMAQGLFPWFTKFNACVPDDRWVQPVVEAFNLHAQIEPQIEGMQPTAEIAIIDPSTTLRHWAPEERHIAEHNDLGFYHALVEARIPFEFLSDQVMTPEALDRFKLIVLANATYLSDAQCAAIEQYVQRGGSVVAANETSLYDEVGNRRDDFGLARVFGASLTSDPRGPVKNTYVALSDPHPLNLGYEGATRIIGGTRLIAVDADASAQTPFLYVPDFPDLPMEEVYPREAPRGAAVVARDTDQGGRTVYIPWNIGEVFWKVLAPDHGRLIANAVNWAIGKDYRVRVDGKGVIDIAVYESDDAMAIFLVNLTNPMMMKGPLREIYPIGQQTVSIKIPPGRKSASAKLLVRGETRSCRVVGDRVEIMVPSIEALETVHLTWHS